MKSLFSTLLAFLILSSCTMASKTKIIGDEHILNEMTINVEILNEDDSKEIRTLLHNGKYYNVNLSKTSAFNICASYNDMYVEVFVDNIDRWARDYINHIYVDTKNGEVSIQYIGRRSSIDRRHTLVNSWFEKLMPLDAFINLRYADVENVEELIQRKFRDLHE